MFYTPAAVRPRGLGAGLALACAPALVALCAATASAEDGPAAAPPQGSCAPDAPCIVVEYEEPVAGVAKQLVDALRLRLSSEKVRVGHDKDVRSDFLRDPESGRDLLRVFV